LVSVAFHLKVALSGADPSTSVRLAAAEGQVRTLQGGTPWDRAGRARHGGWPRP
jgi:hypothetical protein